MTDKVTNAEARLIDLLRSPKRRTFVIVYVENGGNATAAAEAAGFAFPAVEGSRLLRDAKIIEGIEAHSAIVSRVAGESRDTVLARMMNRANINPQDYFDYTEDTAGTLKPLNQLTKRQAQCIKKISWNQNGPVVEWHDPAVADRDIATLTGMNVKEDTALTADDAASLIAAALDRMDELDAPEHSGD
jgi:hypothetical protein